MSAQSNAGSMIPLSSHRRRIRRSAADSEFFAPALAILETPASPIRMALIMAIAALVSLTLAWSFFGTIDIVATAQGKLQPVGRVSVVEPLETGRVATIHVRNGARVTRGSILIELDGSEAQAELTESDQTLASLRAEVVRRRAAIAAAARDPVGPSSIGDWPDDTPRLVRQREDRVLAADLRTLVATIDASEAQHAQKVAEHDQLLHTIGAQHSLITTLQERVDTRQGLVVANAGTRASVLDAREALQSQLTQLAVQEGQLVSLERGAEVFRKEEAKTRESFVSDNAQKLAAAERQVESTEQARARAGAKLEHMTLTASTDGIVQALSVTNPGQVVTTGSEVMRIVPSDRALEAEVYTANRDIGFVEDGQEAVLKLEAFPFTRYGTIKAHVKHVARDAVPAPDASQIEADATQSLHSTGSGGAQRIHNLVYPVTLSLDAASIEADGRSISLFSGMAVTVEFKTGRRRVLDYLLSPMVEVASGSMHDR